MTKVTLPSLEKDTPIEEVITAFKEIGNACKILKKQYPRAFKVMFYQSRLGFDRRDNDRTPVVTEGLYEQKLEVALLEDEELR